jgi:transposase
MAGIPVKGSATDAFRAMCVERYMKQNLKSVSIKIGVAYTTLERWLYQVAPKRLPEAANCEAPKVVNLDEFAVQRATNTTLISWMNGSGLGMGQGH